MIEMSLSPLSEHSKSSSPAHNNGGLSWSWTDSRIFPVSIVIQLEHDNDGVKFLKNRIVPALAKAGLKFAIYRSKDEKSLFCSVYATHRRLLIEADRENFELGLDPVKLYEADCKANVELQDKGAVFGYTDGGDRLVFHSREDLAIPSFEPTDKLAPYRHMYAKFDIPEGTRTEHISLYQVHSEADLDFDLAIETVTTSVLKRTDAIKLLYNIMTIKDEGPGTGAQLDLDKWILNTGNKLSRSKEKVKNYFPVHDSNRAKVVQFMKKSWFWNVPVMHMRHYFGERVAMYFAFLENFTHWLLFPAVVGAAAYIHQLANGSPNISWLPVVGIIVMLWSSVFLENWKRAEAFWAMQWGTSQFEETQVLRMEFCTSSETKRRRSPVTGKPEYHFSPTKRISRLAGSYSLIVLMVFIVMSIVFSIFILRHNFNESKNKFLKSYGNYLASVINALQIQVTGAIYRSIAVAMTDFENHPTETGYENSLITKTCLFTFVNSYFSLFYIAFLKNHLVLFGVQQSCLPSKVGGPPDCLGELASNLGVIFVTQLVVGNFTEVALPYILNNLAVVKAKLCCRKVTTPKPHPLELESALPIYNPFSDYLELLVLFGYVTLFVVAFPLAPLLGLINNLVEIRVDSFKLLNNCARPIPQSAESIGAWEGFLDVLKYISIASNLAVVIFTDTTFLPAWTTSSKLLLFVCLEHFILAVQFGIASVIPDVPGFVEEHLKRQSYLVEKHVDGVEDEVDNFAEEEEEDDDKSVASNKGGHLPANFQLHFHELSPAEDEEGKKEEPPLAPASSARAPGAGLPAAAPPAVKGNPPESLTQRLLDQAEPL